MHILAAAITPLPTEFLPADRRAMHRALALAVQAAAAGEVPVGAVVYDGQGEIVGEGRNGVIGACDPTAHAEIVALRAAAARRGNFRLADCKIAVTLEPCLMCAGAIFQARLQAVVFAAADPKSGALGGVVNMHAQPLLNHHTAIVGGLLAAEAGELLREFFRIRR